QAALNHQRVGLAALWLGHGQDVHAKHLACIDALPIAQRLNRLCEINVLEQVINVSRTIIVQDAWQRGQALTIHGWIYGIQDGRLRDLGLTISDPKQIRGRYEVALESLA
ncbi:MAG: carbonate dehydratase, partial [Proteobacteria bacterium]|nr:carbonate dehydratase [Pseudomonadota bacterium]